MKGPRALGLAVTLVAPPALAAPAFAQHFGQNQVQYRDFDFKVLKTKRFDIYYYPEQQEKIEHVARMAERWYDRLSKVFTHDLEGRQALVFYASGSDFRQTNVVQGIGEGTGGVTEGLMRRIVMPSVSALASQFPEGMGHCRKVTDLALSIFDDLLSLHQMGAHERFLLECTGLLHDIGWKFGHKGHSKRSADMIISDEPCSGSP